jgi:hypothetical protein
MGMENNISWFNEEEFSKYLNEGELTRRAFINSQRRFARAKRMAYDLIARTPLRYMRDAQKKKNAIKSRAMKQTARDYEVAKNMEQDRKIYTFESLDAFDSNFENFITEKKDPKPANKRDTEVNPKPSGNEEASSKNLTGNPKKQARLKRAANREKQGGSSSRAKPKAKPERKAAIKGATRKDPSGFIGVKIKKGKEKDKVEIIPRNEYDESLHELLAGSKPDDKNGKKATIGDLAKLVSDPNFTVTESSKFLGLVKPTQNKKPKPKGKPKPKKEDRAEQKQDVQSQQQGEQELLRLPPEPTEDAPLVIPQSPPGDNDITYSTNQLASMIYQLATPDKNNKLLSKLYTPKQLKALQDELNRSPQLIQIGAAQKQLLIREAIQNREAIAKIASGMDPSDYEKQFSIIQSDKVRKCVKNSQLYQGMGGKDSTPKSDVLVIPNKVIKKILDKIASGKCNFDKEELDSIYEVSLKQGKNAQITSPQEKEASAIMEAVALHLDEFTTNKKLSPYVNNVLFSGMGENGEYKHLIRKIIEKLKEVTAQRMGSQPVFQGRVNYLDFQDPTRRQELQNRNPESFMKMQQIEAIHDQIDQMMEELLKIPIIKALIAYETLSGEQKFQNDENKPDFTPFGRARNVVFSDSKGNPTGTLVLPDQVERLLEGSESEDPNIRRFYMTTRQLNVRASFKPRRWKNQTQTMFSSAFRVFKEHDEMIKFLGSFDNLFEAQFEPYDREIVTTSSQLIPDEEISPNSDQMPDPNFIPFDGMDIMEYAEKVNYNIFRILAGAGYYPEEFEIQPFDAGEMGLMLSSMDTNKKNLITINGREYTVPVINGNEMMESVVNYYNDINDYYVEKVKEGMDLNEALEEMSSVINDIILLERDYKREYRLYHSKPKHRKERSNRVMARRKAEKRYGKKALKGRDVDHKDGNALNNSDSNLRLRSIHNNRSDNGHSKKKLTEGNWKERLDGSWEYTKFLLDRIPGQKIDKSLKAILSKNKGQSR